MKCVSLLSTRAVTEMSTALTKYVRMFQTDVKKKVQFFFPVHGSPTDFFVPRFYGGPPPKQTPAPLAQPCQCGEMQQTAARPQQAVVAATLRQITTVGGATIIAGCGTGKTMMAIKVACELGVKTGVLVHKNFLINQWKERIESFCPGARVGVVQQDRNEDGDFIVMSMKSVLSRDYTLPDFGLLIVDEVHHVPSQSFVKTLIKIKTCYTLGLTATPKRKDGLESLIYDTLGPVSYVVKAPPNPGVQVSVIAYRGVVPSTPGSHMARVIGFLVADMERNRLLVRIAQLMKVDRAGGKGILLSDRVAHLKILHRLMPDGLSQIVCGAMNTTAQGGVNFDQFLTLSTYGLLSEAVDCDADFIILATPRSDVEQSTGRAIRGRSERVPVIIDLGDMSNDKLRAMCRTRRGFYQSKGYKVIDVQAHELAE
jgi:superfamily II DNA or RNA helicase